MSGETGGRLTAEERRLLFANLGTATTTQTASALTAVERILAARLADQDAALARVEALAAKWADHAARSANEVPPHRPKLLWAVAAQHVRAALRTDPSEIKPRWGLFIPGGDGPYATFVTEDDALSSLAAGPGAAFVAELDDGDLGLGRFGPDLLHPDPSEATS